ncbi:MAG: hypothetical protein ACKO96_12125, partial [Flammeovirgaceae bacterium]
DVEDSVDILMQIIDEKINSFWDKNPSRLFIGGFEQGAMVSLATLLKLNYNQPIGGVFALSGP